MTVTTEIKRTRNNGGIDAVKQRSKPGALKVGLLAGLGEHPGSDDGTTIPEIGAAHEFGAGVPERSFIRSTIAENISKYNKMRRDLIKAMVAGEISSSKAVAILGEAVKADVQRKIETLSDPPNSDETIEHKGSSNPLIDTGAMRQSIQWEEL